MYSFKKSVIALVSILVLVMALAALLPLVSRGQGNNPNVAGPLGPRQFYVTQTTHNGSQALTACAEGYHMASLWEIFDPSNRYNTELGFTTGDSGFGPPNIGAAGPAWIRTGGPAFGFEGPGIANCNAWTSASGDHNGSRVGLTNSWTSTLQPPLAISPWVSFVDSCDSNERVWCVQN